MSYDLTYNPFADNDDARPSTSQGFYSSAFFPKQGTLWPLLDERGSNLDGDRKTHLRSLSEIQIVPPNSAGLHPLKSALIATMGATAPDTHVTRPNLFRIVNEGSASDIQDEEGEESTSTATDIVTQQKDVIVHHVTPKDSLAGIALKYGITLANLRRANQLWTSDSIHRRSALYIPVDEASRAQEYVQVGKLIPLTPDASGDKTNVFDPANSSAPFVDEDSAAVDFLKPSVNVVRMPANQLTYFPPSSHKNLDPKPSRHSLDNPSPILASGSRISPASSKYDSSLPNNSLTSILTALPIAASTRDEIITRLSFDGVNSSYSDQSRTSPSEENGHELGEVKKPNRRALTVSLHREVADEMSLPTPKARPRKGSLPPSPTTATRPPAQIPSSVPKFAHTRSVSSNSPPRFYVPQTHETHIRTSQLEPSPAMEIPIRRSHTIGVSSRRKVQSGVVIEQQPNLGKDRPVRKEKSLHSLVQRMEIQDHR